MVNEEYNPDKHCCEEWKKDWCMCVKGALNRQKIESRDKKVKSSMGFLIKNKIEFEKSKMQNVVTTDYYGDRYFISLKTFKFRKEGTNIWIYKHKKMLGMGSSMKFGKHAGKKIKDVKLEDPNYIDWLFNNTEYLLKAEAFK